MRRSPLIRKTRLRSAAKPTDPKVVAQLLERSEGLCELSEGRVRHRGHHPHHRKLKSQGGKDELANLIWVCFDAHRNIHEKPWIALEKGWLLKSWQDPSEVPWLP